MTNSQSPLPNVLAGVSVAAVDDQLRLAQQALGQLRESIVITDTELDEPGPRIVYVNDAFTKMTGWRPEEVIGKSPRFLQGPKTTRQTLDRLRRQLTKGETFEGEDINYRKDGSEFWIDWYIEPLHGSNGEIRYWVAVQRDTTEKRELMVQLLQAQRLEGIGLLASGIAHDLNNVLSPVLMGCDFLREQVTTADALEFIRLIENSAQRGAGLVRQILSFSSGLTGAAGAIDPRHLVDEVARLAETTFPKRIAISAHAPAGLALVRADPTQLYQVLLNLCINARDAIEGEGRITLAARNVAKVDSLGVLPGELPAGPCLRLSVADNGSGMKAATAAKIFDPFFSTKAPGKGTGLGLSTVAMIVRGLGGAIGLETAEGEGTTFSVYLPALTEAAAEPATLPNELPRAGAGRTVLIADHEIAVGTMMRELLETAGYRVQLATSCLEALALSETFSPEVLLLDLGMADANACSDLRERFATIPQIALSALPPDEISNVPRFAESILEKPFTPRQLLEAVQQVLP